jgi:hypothetical protein
MVNSLILKYLFIILYLCSYKIIILFNFFLSPFYNIIVSPKNYEDLPAISTTETSTG